MSAFASLVIGLSACLAQGEPLVVTLRPASSTGGEFTTLADVAVVTGPAERVERAKGVMLGRSPEAGDTATITSGFVAARLRQEGLPVHRVLGAKRTLVVGRDAFPAEVLAAIRDALAREMADDAKTAKLADEAPVESAALETGLPVGRPAVAKGSRVRVLIHAGALRIATDAVALESAEVGELAKLRNERSGTVFSALVTGAGTATPE